MADLPAKPFADKSSDWVEGYNAGLSAFQSELDHADVRVVRLRTLEWWRKLVDLNRRDLAPRLDEVIVRSSGDRTADPHEQRLPESTRSLTAEEDGLLLKALHNSTELVEVVSPGKGEGWREIATEPNDGAFRWYGLHVQHAQGYTWFEAHYIQHDDDGQMKLPSGDNFDDWAFDDFEVWCNPPAPPS